MIRLSGIRIPIIKDSPGELEKAVCSRLNIPRSSLLGYSIFKQSIDARKDRMIHFVYTVDLETTYEDHLLAGPMGRRLSPTPDMSYKYVEPGHKLLDHPPVIVGTGPAGLLSGLILAEMGYRPLLIERGLEAVLRKESVARFWKQGILDPESNVQFGEGGAGTFSDGKLTTQTRDLRNRKVLEVLADAGAPKEILYSFKPHVGTDKLVTVVRNIRNRITALGGEVVFSSRLTDIQISKDRIKAITINDTEVRPTSVLLLAIGHSARDTYAMLHRKGIRLAQKAFSMGVRIEHPQELIDRTQYGPYAGHPKLGAADYKLAYHSPGGRAAYTFCMCPGGTVVAAASSPNSVVTNGMSQYARDGENANSAILVNISPEDFGNDHPLAGIQFQERWEQLAFALGGGNYYAPVQILADFLKNRKSTALGSVKPTYRPGVTFADLRECLPSFVLRTIEEAVPYFESKLKGFGFPEAILTGVETRSSSPVRILRDDSFQCNIKGIYPAGEGAGYAGGIVSSAVDGIKAAEAIAREFRPF